MSRLRFSLGVGALVFIVELVGGAAAVYAISGHIHLSAPITAAVDIVAAASGDHTDGAALSLRPWRLITVRRGDTLSGLFARAGLPHREWARVLALHAPVGRLRYLHPGDVLQLRKTMDGQLQDLRFRIGVLDKLEIHRGKHGLQAKVIHRQPRLRRAFVSGDVRRTLSGSLRAAGASASVAAQVTNIFKWRQNLARVVHPGDHFTVLYEQRFIDGRRLRDGHVVAAELDTGGHDMHAFRYVNDSGDGHYYDLRGQAYRPPIERTPVTYTRVSSSFSHRRLNPILHIYRPHYGVDLAAPTGTPVHAAADGVVVMHKRDGGYGRVVELNHSHGYQTRYAHMSRFATDLYNGEHVHQDQVIGYVGESGEATGPHLHFEIRHDSVPHDPLHMPLPGERQLSGQVLARFAYHAVLLLARLDGSNRPPLRIQVATTNAVACTETSATDALQTAITGHQSPFIAQVLCTPPAG